MRQASGDLFPTDVPIPSSQMIGRGDDVQEISTALVGGTHLIVAGPRRTGKTSVCEAALGRARRRGCYTARLDLFRIADAAELAEALALAVIANRSPAHRVIRRARELGRSALSAAQAAAVLKLQSQLGEAIEVAITPGWAAPDPVRALDLALELPERVAVADDRRLILFFDEFQELASDRRPYGDPDQVTKRMRAVFQRSTSVSYLFAGSLEHVMRDLFAPQQRAFSGFGSFHALRPDPRWGLARRLTDRFAADDCTVRRPPWTGSWSWAPATRGRRCGSPSRPISSRFSSTDVRSTSISSSSATGRRSTATCPRWSSRWSRSAGCTRTRSRSRVRSPPTSGASAPGSGDPRSGAQAPAAGGNR